MITRRDFFTAAASTIAAITGWELGNKLFKEKADAGCEEVSPPVRVYTKEIDTWNNIIDGGRDLCWTTTDIGIMPDVGATLVIERTPGVSPDKKIGTLENLGLRVERFRVIVTRHEVTL